MTTIWDPIKVGNLHLPHRLAMAPMTRSRAKPDGTPGDLAADYYAQRASMGLLITEGTQPSDDGQGYLATPGIYTDRHVEGWRQVTQAVHRAGGNLFIQLMHAGRMSHPNNTPHHRQPVAPSAVAAGQKMFTASGLQETPTPRALGIDEIAATIRDFRRAARSAVAVGADGVEIHGANGYLLHQFLASNANLRADRYGGPLENRARFAVEVAAAVADEIGPERTAIRLSPGAPLGGIVEGPDGPDLYHHLVGELDKIGLAYLHLFHFGDEALLAGLRRLWSKPLILLRAERTLGTLGADVAAGRADMVAIGKWALANPDFAARLKAGAQLNEPDPKTFYGGGAAGYTDYPPLGAAQAA